MTVKDQPSDDGRSCGIFPAWGVPVINDAPLIKKPDRKDLGGDDDGNAGEEDVTGGVASGGGGLALSLVVVVSWRPAKR
ncbi:hypothetical protein R6Q59_005910 [Mikania micrantha]